LSLWPKESPSGVSGNAGLTLSSETYGSQITVRSRGHLLAGAGFNFRTIPFGKTIEMLKDVHIPQGWVLLQ